jgi:hypothetical protein
MVFEFFNGRVTTRPLYIGVFAPMLVLIVVKALSALYIAIVAIVDGVFVQATNLLRGDFEFVIFIKR